MIWIAVLMAVYMYKIHLGEGFVVGKVPFFIVGCLQQRKWYTTCSYMTTEHFFLK